MRLGSETFGHAHDGVVIFGEDYVLEGVVVVGLGKHRGDDVGDVPAEHDTEEALGRFIEIAGKHQTLVEGGVGGSKDDRMLIHGDQSLSSNRRGTRFFIMVFLSRATRLRRRVNRASGFPGRPPADC